MLPAFVEHIIDLCEVDGHVWLRGVGIGRGVPAAEELGDPWIKLPRERRGRLGRSFDIVRLPCGDCVGVEHMLGGGVPDVARDKSVAARRWRH